MKKEQDMTNNKNMKSIDLVCRKDMQESQAPLPAAPLPIAPYLDQLAQWPNDGQRVLAHYDETSVIVYQAYRPSIARYAVEHGRFGGHDFSFNRMSWIKPNFLWMMYRCGCAGPSSTACCGKRLRPRLRRRHTRRPRNGVPP